MDKLHSVHDGIVNNVNPWIKRHQLYRTTAPGLHDVTASLMYCSNTHSTILTLDVSIGAS
jgi:hypothetical protein